MKSLKKSLSFLFVGLLTMSVLVSCQKEAIEDLSQIETTEWSDTESPELRVPDNGTTTCYTASLSLDKDCDGVFETGWNQATASYGGCTQLLLDMIETALDNGWCYRVARPNCGIYIGTCR